MQAAIWSIPLMEDSSPSEDNLSTAPVLELQTRIDTSSYGDVKRFVFRCSFILEIFFENQNSELLIYFCNFYCISV